MYSPDFPTFKHLAGQGALIPVYREIMADMDTPVTAFRKIDDGRYSFLLESIEGGEKWARYTFLGSSPSTVVRSRGNIVEVLTEGRETQHLLTEDPLTVVRDILARYSPVQIEGLPRFFGGAVGYFGYDMVRHFERLPTDKPAVIGAWDSLFVITDTIVIFDTMAQKIKVVSNAHLEEGVSPEAAYAKATAKIEALIRQLRSPLPPNGADCGDTPGILRLQYHQGTVRASGPVGQRVCPGRGHHPGGAVAALLRRCVRRPLRHLPGAPDSEPFSLHVLPPVR